MTSPRPGLPVVVPLPGLLLLLLLVGCCPPHAPLPHQTLTNPWRPLTAAHLDDAADASQLQIIIAYAEHTCMHTALRLLVPGEPPLFWDPGGNYGNLEPLLLPRRADIVLQPPTLPAYLAFRWTVATASVEILQFDLPPAQTRRWLELFRANLRDGGPPPAFHSTTPGMFCAHAVSGFLHDYGGPRFAGVTPTMFPHLFAASLYPLHPDRIWRFDRDGTILTHP